MSSTPGPATCSLASPRAVGQTKIGLGEVHLFTPVVASGWTGAWSYGNLVLSGVPVDISGVGTVLAMEGLYSVVGSAAGITEASPLYHPHGPEFLWADVAAELAQSPLFTATVAVYHDVVLSGLASASGSSGVAYVRAGE